MTKVKNISSMNVCCNSNFAQVESLQMNKDGEVFVDTQKIGRIKGFTSIEDFKIKVKEDNIIQIEQINQSNENDKSKR